MRRCTQTFFSRTRRLMLAGAAAIAFVLPVALGDGPPATTPVVVAAPTTLPQVGVPTEPRAKAGHVNKAAKSAAAAAAVEVVNFSPEQWLAFKAFMERESPRKWATFQQLKQQSANRTKKLEESLATRYQALKTISNVDPSRYEFELTAIRIEDQVYGVLQDLRSRRGSSEQNESKLRELARAFVDNRQAWREERIQRAREELTRLGLKKAAAAVGDEWDREQTSRKKSRDEQAEQMAAKWKHNANQPRLRPTLPGAERPPAEPLTPVGPE